MKIKPTPNHALNCYICIQEKMSNDRNKTLNCEATKILTLLLSDLADSIQPFSKNGYKYVLDFIDNYSSLMLYFLKHKSNTLLATMKYLANITSYGHVKCLNRDNGTEFILNLFNGYLYLISSNMSRQLLIPYVKMGLLSVHGKPYFP